MRLPHKAVELLLPASRSVLGQLALQPSRAFEILSPALHRCFRREALEHDSWLRWYPSAIRRYDVEGHPSPNRIHPLTGLHRSRTLQVQELGATAVAFAQVMHTLHLQLLSGAVQFFFES